MSIGLSGKWNLTKKDGENCTIDLPGTINGSGLGDNISASTDWNSGLHNPFWFEREEYKSGTGEDYHVPFLSQPKTAYSGKATYERSFTAEKEDGYYFFLELSKWRIKVEIDGNSLGEDESLCAPFVFGPVKLLAGEHSIKVEIDNSLLYPYRPDGHAVSDALDANWNGMGGRIELLSTSEYEDLLNARKAYRDTHPVTAEVVDRNIVINGKAEYIRATHFGGFFPETLYPSTDKAYWERIIKIIKDYGFNTIRCHSFCPPEACFEAADEAGLFLLIECGMWNTFSPENREMYGILLKETRKILEAFGHHPSFVMMSPSNEPGGNWYEPLRNWVKDAKAVNAELGFDGRRLFTAESGWFYDVPPAEITGTDFIYFHRSAYGQRGGMIRNMHGFRGKDYSFALPNCKLPVMSHEMGQWCSYPDFSVTEKFKDKCIRGGNYEIFRDNAKENGVLEFNKAFTYASGKQQVRLLKEEFEANFRTPEITGFEYLDLHDYPGQGTAVVGVLDPFFDSKGYTEPSEFGQFNADIVILPRIDGYVYKNTDRMSAPVEVANFGGKDLHDAIMEIEIYELEGFLREEKGKTICSRSRLLPAIPAGMNTKLFTFEFDFGSVTRNVRLKLVMRLKQDDRLLSENSWNLSCFVKKTADREAKDRVAVVRNMKEAAERLDKGETVVYLPYISDMDHECPPLGMRSVFWNAQMGPSWTRPLGIVCSEHPLFKYFPTDCAGGWQWEDILAHARGFNISPKHSAIVRAVDDWNRNFPLSFIFEGRVSNGKLLFCSADLSGNFENRPAANVLFNALISYAGSEDFDPQETIEIEELTKHLKPMLKASDIIDTVKVKDHPEVTEEELNALLDINPNNPFRLSTEQLPVSFEIKLLEPVTIERLLVLPIQSDRDFTGIIKEYGIKINGKEFRGEWKSAFETQYSVPVNEKADKLELVVYSTYSMGTATRWLEEATGYYKKTSVEPLTVTAAFLGIEYREEGSIRHSDELFWKVQPKPRQKEIDT